MANIKDLKQKAKNIRKNIIWMLNHAQSGHTGGSLGMADVFTALYFNIFKTVHSDEEDRERFILSNGHICPVWYATLSEKGIIQREELLTLRKIDSRLQGHPANKDMSLLEISTGSLGQGFSASVGLALGYKMDKKKSHIFVGLGDGEMQEGSVWEAMMAAGHYKLNNLVAFLDRNKVQQSGKTEDMMSLEPLKEKIESFNWKVYEADGHKFKDIIKTFEKAKKDGKPSFIILHTHMGEGVSFMKDNFKWHGRSPSDEEAEKALKEIEAM